MKEEIKTSFTNTRIGRVLENKEIKISRNTKYRANRLMAVEMLDFVISILSTRKFFQTQRKKYFTKYKIQSKQIDDS